LYEAITHAHNRQLYKMRVTTSRHVQRMFTDAYPAAAMKLFALRACDYMRSAATHDDRVLAAYADGHGSLPTDVVAARGRRASSPPAGVGIGQHPLHVREVGHAHLVERRL